VYGYAGFCFVREKYMPFYEEKDKKRTAFTFSFLFARYFVIGQKKRRRWGES
jgi:hypothetical protein